MAQAASDRLGLADSILREALELPVEERSRVVRERCGSDTELGNSLLRLISNFDQLGDFLENPHFAVSDRAEALAPGSTLATRFRIVSFVGRGGMGDVYRAEDLELGVEVALKTIRRAWCADEGARSRFREEIRLARQVSHPNVCRIFDLFLDRIGSEEILFFTMEYLDGETLAARLVRGPIAPEHVIPLASAIADGLTAAHNEGIVHRDLKPSNIMLTSGRDGAERTVIMDFGLAASVAACTTFSTDELIGSPDYMAPEQFLGTAPAPTADVYALGVMVYEMIAGHRPFPTEPTFRMALRRLTQNPPDLRAVASLSSDEWGTAVQRALARDPAERFQSAREFMQGLRNSSQQSVSRRRFLALGAAGITVAGLLSILRVTRWKPARVVDPVLMIMPCSYASNDARSRSMARIVDVLLRTQLRQSAFLGLLRPEQIQTAWHLIGSAGSPDLAAMDPATARHIVLRTTTEGQTPFVLFENIARAGDRFTLLMSLERVGGSPEFALEGKPWHLDLGHASELPDASFAGAKWVREVIGESKAEVDARNRRSQELTTSEWQALQEYELADTAWKQNEADAAILHLKTAVAMDPDFAFAEARLADHLVSLGRPDEGYQHWSRADQLLQKRNLTDRESLSIRGRFALDVGLHEKAEDVFSRYALEFPKDGLGFFYKADAVARQGRIEEAEHLLDQAIEKNPQSLSFVLDRAALHLESGDLETAERDWRIASTFARGDWVDLFAAALALGRGRFDAARNALSRLSADGSLSFQSRAFALMACFRSEQGAWPEAEHLLEEGMTFDRANGQPRSAIEQKQRLLAELLLRQNKRARAIELCHLALENVSGLQMQMHFGCVLAQAGDLQGARRCAKSAVPAWPAYQVWAKRLEGEIALASGQALRALALMKQAVQPPSLRIWPAHLARAAIAAHDYITAGACLDRLLTRPSIYWLAAEQNTPGMLRYAALAVDRLQKWPVLAGRTKFFRALLEDR